jgi:putative transposase
LYRSHKIRLDPNAAQAEHFARACGVARFAWNWALAEWKRQYEACKLDAALPRPSEGALRRQLNAIKREQFPWMLEVTKSAPEESIIALGQSFKNWFSSLSGVRRGPKMQAPRFKRKGIRDTFKTYQIQVDNESRSVRIPKLGWVRLREELRFSGKLVQATVSRTANAWFISILVETEDVPERCKSQAAVGVDLGLKQLAVLSTGESFNGPKALGTLLARMRLLSRAHSRKAKGSKNRVKSARRLAKLHWRITCVRQDAMHKLTNRLCNDYGWIAIEDLNVKGMMANHRLARHLTDASFGELRRQLTYKAEQRGVHLAVVDRWFPSSKTCSACGEVHEALTLAERVWSCTACGVAHDRDVNAARNILAQSIKDSILADGASATACGAKGPGSKRKLRVKPVALKQEVNA